MAGRIPQHFIDELLARADIVELIDARVPLKKRGREYMACCPFHNEKTPSFTVSPQKQFYHCFGCGAHGTALGFLMEYERMDFVEAIEALAESQGLEVPREGGEAPPRPAHDELYDLLGQAAAWFQQQLKTHPEAVDYLKGRGLSGQIAAEFGLGYAPDTWDGLLKHLGGERAAPRLQEAGLVIKRDNGGYYDRFRQRIQFPIRDRRGRVIGFGGRVIGEGEPKYLNSPETPTFHKGLELYGLYEARKAPGELNRILVVEGYMDVIALAQSGIRNAVATLGTATTREHLERLYRVVPSVVFCFDGDRAGQKAAWRALENALPVLRDGLEAYFLFLPEGEDPDSLVRRIGKERFETLVDEASGLSDVLIEGLKQRFTTASREGRASLAEAAKGLLKQLTPGLLREQVLDALARVLNLGVERMSSYFEAPPDTPPPEAPRAAPAKAQVRRTPVRVALEQLLLQPALAQEVGAPQILAELDIPGIPLLIEVIRTLAEQPTLSAAGLIERWHGRPERSHLLKLLSLSTDEVDESIRKKEFHDALGQLLAKRDEARWDYLNQKARTGGLAGLGDDERDELRSLSQRKRERDRRPSD